MNLNLFLKETWETIDVKKDYIEIINDYLE